ncbi:cytochrome oxidase assembly protein-domain-containing protein [Sphaerosporella brunnea]|uniref:Cytochrome oxidase assembly protein-domain-containing protein n=1 Tax=Sphaerosporella brunnea TaxID=1250544 RepID=A0A5J5F4Y2_9PEZI|nr:cytochrome oxidase assembly protein-domain-containing protein [Sphaerosporella brunnea]
MSFSTMPGRLLLRSRLSCNSACLPKLPRQVCPYTLPTTSRTATVSSTLSSLASRQRSAFRSFSFTSKSLQGSTVPKADTSPLPGLANSLSRPAKAAASWPEISDRKVGFWLIGSATLVFGIVVLGGLTRLTESGLSITEWKPVTGTLPPLSHEDWMDNFNKYKDSPEYRILNPNMTLDEYKFIYFMEWGHRLWGRAIGLTFVLPAIYFTVRRHVTPKTALRLLGISAMIGFQGFIGWWMVKSGLQDDLFAEPGSHPRVSQYRLTAHLGAAFAVYSAMLWSGLDILRDNRLLKSPKGALKCMKDLSVPQLRVFRGLVGLIVAMVFTTAMTGGLVAGLDAGLIYNEFPKMGLGFMPPTKEMMDPFYSHTDDHSDLWWRSLLENPTTVQFQHRVAAMTTFTTICAVFAYSRFNSRVAAAMPKHLKKGLMGVLHLAMLQVLLGISTLIYMVPTHLAATHQAGALALLTGSIVLGHRVWLPRTAARIAAKRLEVAALKGTAAAKKP